MNQTACEIHVTSVNGIEKGNLIDHIIGVKVNLLKGRLVNKDAKKRNIAK